MNEDHQNISIEIFDLTNTEEYSMALPDFIEWITNKIKTIVPDEFIDSVRIKGTVEYGPCDSYNVVTATYERPETDHEMLSRIAENRLRTEQLEYSERREFNRLKSKFG